MKTSTMIMNFSVEKENKRIKVEREFDAPILKVWNAWTDSKMLDQWWAPKPWKAQTKHMNFARGGHWLYAMVGPDGNASWCKADYKEVEPMKRFTVTDYFCDEQGNIDNSFPVAHWEVTFSERNTSTLVNIQISFNETADLDRYIEMGFREGFTAALENLDGMV